MVWLHTLNCAKLAVALAINRTAIRHSALRQPYALAAVTMAGPLADRLSPVSLTRKNQHDNVYVPSRPARLNGRLLDRYRDFFRVELGIELQVILVGEIQLQRMHAF